jgi:hypothetical protein
MPADASSHTYKVSMISNNTNLTTTTQYLLQFQLKENASPVYTKYKKHSSTESNYASNECLCVYRTFSDSASITLELANIITETDGTVNGAQCQLIIEQID